MNATFHHVDDGQVEKPALLMVHGFLSSHRHWEVNAALGQDFRLIRLDLPAHGLSPASRDPDTLRPEALVQALDDLRRCLDIPRWSLCGQSFGAGLTLRYALTYPDRVAAQVFTNANAALSLGWSEDRILRNRHHLDIIARLGLDGLRKLPFHPRHARRLPAGPRETLLEDADRVEPEGFSALLAHTLPALSVRARLAGLSTPTLLVNGRFEKSFQAVRAHIAAAHPQIAITDLDGGHAVNIECAEEFTTAARNFLRGRAGAS